MFYSQTLCYVVSLGFVILAAQLSSATLLLRYYFGKQSRGNQKNRVKAGKRHSDDDDNNDDDVQCVVQTVFEQLINDYCESYRANKYKRATQRLVGAYFRGRKRDYISFFNAASSTSFGHTLIMQMDEMIKTEQQHQQCRDR